MYHIDIYISDFLCIANISSEYQSYFSSRIYIIFFYLVLQNNDVKALDIILNSPDTSKLPNSLSFL